MSAGNGAAAGPVQYEAQSPAMQARMCAILWAEQPGVYAWVLGYAAAGRPPSQVRKRRAPDLVTAEPEERSMVGGR